MNWNKMRPFTYKEYEAKFICEGCKIQVYHEAHYCKLKKCGQKIDSHIFCHKCIQEVD